MYRRRPGPGRRRWPGRGRTSSSRSGPGRGWSPTAVMDTRPAWLKMPAGGLATRRRTAGRSTPMIAVVADQLGVTAPVALSGSPSVSNSVSSTWQFGVRLVVLVRWRAGRRSDVDAELGVRARHRHRCRPTWWWPGTRPFRRQQGSRHRPARRSRSGPRARCVELLSLSLPPSSLLAHPARARVSAATAASAFVERDTMVSSDSLVPGPSVVPRADVVPNALTASL